MSDLHAIVPRPKTHTPKPGRLALRRDTRILYGSGPGCEEGSARLRERLSSLTGVRLRSAAQPSRSRPKNAVLLRLAKTLPSDASRQEGYRIRVNRDGAVLEAITARGLLYAVGSFIQLIEKDADAWAVPACEVVDWPDFSWRGFLIDPARRFIPTERILQYIEWMGRSRMNVLHIHFTDNEGFTLESEKFPELNRRNYHHMLFGSPRQVFTLDDIRRAEREYAGVYSKADVGRLVSYAQERGVDIVPELGLPSHAAPIIRVFPDLQCQVREGRSSETVMCIGAERTYEVLADLVDEIAPLFPSEYFHIGADEIDCQDVLFQRAPFYAQCWSKCAVCRQRVEKEGLTNVHQLFYYFINRVGELLSEHGKRTVAWNDYIDLAKPVSLSREVLVQFWRIAMAGRGPHRGCSFNKLLATGFEVINSYWPEAYLDVCIEDERLARWNPTKTPFSAKRLKNHIIGGEMHAWNHREFYARSIPSAIPFFADRVWNKEPVADLQAFARSVARHIFGPASPPELYEVFEFLGSIIPPSQDGIRARAPASRAFAGAQEGRESEYRRFERLMRDAIRTGKCENIPTLMEYAKSVRWVREQMASYCATPPDLL